ncbi:MAG: hypothetical protein Q4B78_05390, partial [Bacillota bacterium]|nr:hypothetical protein [Bacillota bacterium]
EEYPNLEFQSHTWALHNRVKGEKPVNSFTVKQLEEDAALQYNTFGYTALAYPWGTTSDNMIEALKNEGHTNIAFTYGENEYATREDDQFYVNRIKINGPGNLKDFKKWFK